MSYYKALNIYIEKKKSECIDEVKEYFMVVLRFLGMTLFVAFALFTTIIGFPTLIFELFLQDIYSVPVIKAEPKNHQFEIYCHTHKIMIKLYGTVLLSALSLYLIEKYKKNEIISIKKTSSIIIVSLLCLIHIFTSNNNIYNNFICVLWCMLSIVIYYYCYHNFQKYKEKVKIEIEEIEKSIMV
jgi:hypothetical protein